MVPSVKLLSPFVLVLVLVLDFFAHWGKNEDEGRGRPIGIRTHHPRLPKPPPMMIMAWQELFTTDNETLFGCFPDLFASDLRPGRERFVGGSPGFERARSEFRRGLSRHGGRN